MDYKYDFEKVGDTLIIHTFDGEQELENYEIRIEELALLSPDGSRVSQWVEHLSHKKWVTYEGLYQLGDEIRMYHPDNDISWAQTFTDIEQLRYFRQKEQEAGLRDKKGEKTSAEVAENTFNIISLRKDLKSQEGFNDYIKGIVQNKLQERGIEE